MTQLKVRAAPSSLIRLHAYATRKDIATAALVRLLMRHAPELAGRADVQRATDEVLKAHRQLETALAIELEADAQLGPEAFILE